MVAVLNCELIVPTHVCETWHRHRLMQEEAFSRNVGFQGADSVWEHPKPWNPNLFLLEEDEGKAKV